MNMLSMRTGLLLVLFTVLLVCEGVQNERPAPILTPIQELLPMILHEYQKMPKLSTQSHVLKLNELLEYWFNFATQLKACRETCGSITWQSAKSSNGNQFWHPLLTIDCFAKCANVSESILSLNMSLLKDMMVGKHYHRLHDIHFASEEYEMAVACAYSFWLRNPKSSSKQLVSRYLGAQQQMRDVEPAAYLRVYFDGVLAYNEHDWMRAAKKMEAALHLYYSEFDACCATCEFLSYFADHQDTDFRAETDTFLTDKPMLDAETLQADMWRPAVRYLAECVSTCRHRLDTDGYDTHNGPYHPQLYHYAQFAYYQLGDLQSAASATQSYLELLPNDPVMLNNKDCYLHRNDSSHNCFAANSDDLVLIEEDFVPDARMVKFVETSRFVDAVLDPVSDSDKGDENAHDEL